MKKKILSLLVAIAVMLCMVPVMAFADVVSADDSFRIDVAGADFTAVTKVEKGYKSTVYNADGTTSDINVDLYTVAVPEGTSEVTLEMSNDSIVYNYDLAGNYLAGWLDDATKGTKNITVKVDSDANGEMDAVQVQNPYNADWTGGELRYAITFTTAKKTADGYKSTVYNADGTTSEIAVDLYTITVPKGTAEANLDISKESIVYNYDFAGNYLAGWLDDATKGTKNIDVKVDSDANGEMDAIQIQNPYNADWTGGELRYAVTFKEDKSADIAGIKATTVTASLAKSSKGIKVSWKKSAGYKVDNYQIYRATKKSGKYTKIYTTKSGKTTSYTNKGLKKGKTYYYKVRGVRKIDGKNYYTKWSSVKSKKF